MLEGDICPLVITHKNCNDGFGAAWVVRKAYPKADFYGATHGYKPPDVAGRHVLITDFSYDRNTILAMRAVAKSLTVIDHHVTAQENLKDIPDCYFDLNKCASRLVFDKFVEWKLIPDQPCPPLVLYVEDRDLDRWQLPQTREVNAAISIYPMDFNEWDNLNERLSDDIDEVAREGRPAFRFQQKLIDDVVARAREVVLDNYNVLACNTSVLPCDVAGRLAENRPFGLAWFNDGNGRFVYSLRSDDHGIDVAKIAKMHGGGGHTHMAGVCSEKPLF